MGSDFNRYLRVLVVALLTALPLVTGVPMAAAQVYVDIHCPAVTAPVINVDFAPGAVFTGTAVLSGTVSDDLAVARVRVAVRDRATKQWLQHDGSFGDGYAGFRRAATGYGTTQLAWSFQVDLAAGKYSLSVQAWDDAGNVGRLRPWAKFNVG